MDVEPVADNVFNMNNTTSRSMSSGTYYKNHPNPCFLDTSRVFLDDSSSDDEQLHTPLTEFSYPIHVVASCSNDSTVCKATRLSSPEAMKNDIHSLLRVQAHSGSPQETNTFACQELSPVLSSPLASSIFNSTTLGSTPLLDTKIELDGSNTNMYPIPCPSAVCSSHSSSNSSCRVTRSSLSQSCQLKIPLMPRKRAPTLENSIASGHISRKPRLSRSPASEIIPSTMARTYSDHFTIDHRLNMNFIQQYTLDAELGSGGYGFVMAGHRRCDRREVAVKFIMKNKMPSHGWSLDNNGRRVPKEAKLLSLVRHPGIVRFYDLFEDESYFYLVQELHGTPWFNESHLKNVQTFTQGHIYPTANTLPSPPALFPLDCPKISSSNVSNKNINTTLNMTSSANRMSTRPSFIRRPSHDLFECIEQSKYKRFSEEDAKYIFAQVVDVVDYLDKLGICHCDIKDENVVIDRELRIKLIDFGSVVSTDPLQPRPYYHRFFGTAAYASPEILKKYPYQAPAAEVWSLGVLLSFLLTGSSPFKTESDKLLGKVTLDNAVLQRISVECMHLLDRCLDINPKTRATIAEIKSHQWLDGALARGNTAD